MESPLLSILCTHLLILLIKKLMLHKTSNPCSFPPGPWKLLIIGNIHQLLGEHPHRRLQNLAKTYDPLFHLKLGEINLIRVMYFKFIKEEEGNNLVEKIMKAKRSPVNLSEMLLSLSNVTIVRAAFGKGSTQQKRFLLAMKKTFKYLSRLNLVDMFPSWSFVVEISGMRHAMEQVHKEMDCVLNEIIEDYEGKKLDGDDMNEDLVDVLLRTKRNGEMDLSPTMENVKAVILDLFLAGSESSSTTLVWAMIELIRHPKPIPLNAPPYDCMMYLRTKLKC
ncbi:hypothetical protein KFK09_008901 [Dendrobium nobile]|uniref:Cytochrome P450 n=1 Tax=Dendrobium nobile TaxID=94219 RepID=A0A8T3BP12_DENNO|nr:hypothetical protein KFK09_008901 [Dendrobium nobile]